MYFFEIMKYFARAIKQMRAVDGILIPQFPWPYAMFWLYVSYLSGFKNALLLSCLDKNEKCLLKDR